MCFEVMMSLLYNACIFRYKYLEKMHEEEMTKLLVYLKGFTEDQRTRLAQITALWLASGQIPSTILPVLINVSNLCFSRRFSSLRFLDSILVSNMSPKFLS